MRHCESKAMLEEAIVKLEEVGSLGEGSCVQEFRD